MGMTTERIIEIFNDHDRISGILLCGNSEDDSLFNSETIEAMNNINVILHKYQKIEQILDDWKSDGGVFEISASYWLKQIRVVVEDGKIDN